MEPQNLTPEFLKFIANFYHADGTRQHDKMKGVCKCGKEHGPYELQIMAMREFREKKTKPGTPVGLEPIRSTKEYKNGSSNKSRNN